MVSAGAHRPERLRSTLASQESPPVLVGSTVSSHSKRCSGPCCHWAAAAVALAAREGRYIATSRYRGDHDRGSSRQERRNRRGIGGAESSTS